MGTNVNFGTQQYFGFDPRSVPDCALWLDGADSNAMTLSGSNVTQWNDKSGNGRNAVQSTTAKQPQKVSSGVLFTAANSNFMTMNVPFSQNQSVFAVLTQNATGGAYLYARSTATGGGPAILSYTNRLRYYDVTDDADFLSGTTVSGKNIIGFVRTSGVNVLGTYNGNQAFSISQSYATNGSAVYDYLGSTDGIVNFYDGTLSELIFYSSALSTIDRQRVEGYLAWKWGMNSNFPVGHPYRFEPIFARSLQPPDIDGLILWLDSADQGSNSMALSGSTITTWKDKSGNGYDFTSQVSPAIGTLSNLPIVDTTGGGCFINGSFSVPTTYSGFTTGYSTVTSTWSGLFYGTPDAIFMLRAYLGQMFLWKGNSGSWGSPSVGTGPSSTTNTIWSFTNPTTSGPSYLWVNGTLNQSNTGVANIATSGLDIGRWVNNSYPWSGYIGDVVFYDGAVSDADRQRIEGFLGWKMGLKGSLPSTHPFYKFPPSTAIFHPMILSNSTLWLDGADSTSNSMTFSGSNITVWKDKSSNGKNFTASGTGATLNTNPAGLLFTTNLYTSAHNASITSNETMFVVFYSTKTSSPSFPIGSSGAGGREIGFRTTSSFGIVNNGVEWGAQGSATSNTLYVASSIISNSGSSTAFAINGGSLSTSNISAFYGSTTTQLGREGASSFQYEGTICEVIAYSRVLSSNERRKVEGYLAWKWGLNNSLPSNHPFYKFRS